MKLSSTTTIALLLLASARIASAQGEEARNHLLHDLGGPFIVYRDPVQKELKLSDPQKRQLQEKLSEYLQDPMKEVEKLKNLDAGEREQQMGAIRQKSYTKFWPLLKETLKAEQFTRLHQLELQHGLK